MQHTHPKIQKNADKTFSFVVTLTQKQIEEDKARVLTEAQTQYQSKGFRKGKAPLDVVESSISDTDLVQEILSHLLSHEYQHIISQNNLKPVIDPQIKIINSPLDFNKDWQVEITSCELPDIKLSPDYKKEVSRINAAKPDDNQRLNQTIDLLIKQSKVNLPRLLIQSDVQKQLTRLIDQVQSSNLTIDQYLKSKNETIKSYTEKLEKQISQEWQLNLCISQIAIDEKLTVSQQEIDQVTAKQPDLKQNLNMVYYLLTQQKVFDFLKSL